MKASGLRGGNDGLVVAWVARIPLRPAPAADSDAELLGCFVQSSNEAAFTEIVRRHGPMVLGVCRQIDLNPLTTRSSNKTG